MDNTYLYSGTLNDPLEVRVTDNYGNPIANGHVCFAPRTPEAQAYVHSGLGFINAVMSAALTYGSPQYYSPIPIDELSNDKKKGLMVLSNTDGLASANFYFGNIEDTWYQIDASLISGYECSPISKGAYHTSPSKLFEVKTDNYINIPLFIFPEARHYLPCPDCWLGVMETALEGQRMEYGYYCNEYFLDPSSPIIQTNSSNDIGNPAWATHHPLEIRPCNRVRNCHSTPLPNTCPYISWTWNRELFAQDYYSNSYDFAGRLFQAPELSELLGGTTILIGATIHGVSGNPEQVNTIKVIPASEAKIDSIWRVTKDNSMLILNPDEYISADDRGIIININNPSSYYLSLDVLGATNSLNGFTTIMYGFGPKTNRQRFGISADNQIIVKPNSSRDYLFYHFKNTTGRLLIRLSEVSEQNFHVFFEFPNNRRLDDRNLLVKKQCESGCNRDCSTGLWSGPYHEKSGTIGDIFVAGGSWSGSTVECLGSSCSGSKNKIGLGSACFYVGAGVSPSFFSPSWSLWGHALCYSQYCVEDFKGASDGFSFGGYSPFPFLGGAVTFNWANTYWCVIPQGGIGAPGAQAVGMKCTAWEQK
jgi:hypothetical protein